MTDFALNPVVLLLAVGAGLGLFLWIVRQPVRGLYLIFFSAGILITPELPLVREKFALPEVLFLLTWTAILFHPRAITAHGRLTGSQHLSLLVLGAFLVVLSASFAVNNAVYEVHFAGSLVETVNIVYAACLFGTVVFLVRDWSAWLNCLLAWGAGAFVVALVGTYSVFYFPPEWAVDEFTGRISSTLKFENQVPSYLLPILPAIFLLAAGRGLDQRWRLLLLATVTMIFVTLAGTGSRTAVAMLMVFFASMVLVVGQAWNWNVMRRALVVNAGMAAVGVAMLYSIAAIALYDGHYALGKTPAWQRPVVMLYEWAQGERVLDNTRDDQIAAVAEHLGDYSLLGTGPKLAATRIRSHGEVHNTYLAVLIETGIIGAALFFAWLLHVAAIGFSALRTCRLPRARLLIAACLVGLATLLVYGLFIHGLRQRNLWMIAGLIVAVPGILKATRETTVPVETEGPGMAGDRAASCAPTGAQPPVGAQLAARIITRKACQFLVRS